MKSHITCSMTLVEMEVPHKGVEQIIPYRSYICTLSNWSLLVIYKSDIISLAVYRPTLQSSTQRENLDFVK